MRGNHEIGTLDGKDVISWSTYKKRVLDQKGLRSVYPEIVESYMETREIRTFKVIDE